MSLRRSVWGCLSLVVDDDAVTLIEWTRLEPGQVEAVVALLTNREHPTTVRITPSRGDGGVDILGRGLGRTGGDVVFQVKSYTEGLNQRQKDSIEDSLNTVQVDVRWEGLNIEEWRLVTPWNPSPEAETWLHGLGTVAGISTVWHGLDHVEQLTAKYPDVIDYYLHGGRERIAAAQAELLALLGLEKLDADVTHQEATDRIRHALGVLDRDPFYRFEYRFGEGTPPEPSIRPGLVMHTLRSDSSTGQWTVVDIIGRCAAAEELSPITISGKVTVAGDAELAEGWKAFVMYGAPLTLPAGSVEGEIVAPGGLGGSLDGAVLCIGPSSQADLGANPELHLEVLDPAGDVLAEVDVDRVDRSTGAGGGLRVVLREVNDIFSIEDRYDLADLSATRSFRLGNITGLPIGVARAGIEALTKFKTPNVLRISTRHTPAALGVTDPYLDFGWNEDILKLLAATERTLRTLDTIQAHTRTPLVTPDFTKVPKEQFQHWRIAASMLDGKDVTGAYQEGHAVTVDLETEVTPVGEDIRILMPYVVLIGDQQVDLGHYELRLHKPTLMACRANTDGTFAHTFTTEGRLVTHRLPPAEQD